MHELIGLALASSLLTAPAADWITACEYGTYQDRASNQLSSGRVETGLCGYSTTAVSQVNIRYHKTGGKPATLRFAWEFTDRRGERLTGTRHDLGRFRQSAGQTRYYAWKYPFPGVERPVAPLTCVRGVLLQYDDTDGFLVGRYQTRVICR